MSMLSAVDMCVWMVSVVVYVVHFGKDSELVNQFDLLIWLGERCDYFCRI